jgi:hypothetical protein
MDNNDFEHVPIDEKPELLKLIKKMPEFGEVAPLIYPLEQTRYYECLKAFKEMKAVHYVGFAGPMIEYLFLAYPKAYNWGLMKHLNYSWMLVPIPTAKFGDYEWMAKYANQYAKLFNSQWREEYTLPADEVSVSVIGPFYNKHGLLVFNQQHPVYKFMNYQTANALWYTSNRHQGHENRGIQFGTLAEPYNKEMYISIYTYIEQQGLKTANRFIRMSLFTWFGKTGIYLGNVIYPYASSDEDDSTSLVIATRKRSALQEVFENKDLMRYMMGWERCFFDAQYAYFPYT